MNLKIGTTLFLGFFLLGLISGAPFKDEELIDGKSGTIASLITKYLMELAPYSEIGQLIVMIINAFTAPEFDYWGNVKSEVEAMVGSYINEHNMHQVEIYQEDLQDLMQRYSDAPVQSDTYPDKNLQASALSTSIVTHRYLTEAALQPESMILHFEDIASIHIVVLKDVAETYSPVSGPPSRWWVDLDTELDHYITYSEKITNDLRTWRLDQVSCEAKIAGPSCTDWEWAGTVCYDVYTARDAVTGEVSECQQLHGSTTCSNHCELFEEHKKIEVEKFNSVKINDVINAWKDLKELSSEMASQASQYYNVLKQK